MIVHLLVRIKFLTGYLCINSFGEQMSSISSATSARPQNLSFMGNGGRKEREEKEVGEREREREWGSQKRLIDLE